MVREPGEVEKSEQREVQRLLGHCLLRLQSCERLLKALLAERAFSGEARDLESSRARRESRMARNTLGSLVGEFAGSYPLSAEAQELSDPAEDAADGPGTVSFRMTCVLAPEDHAQAVLDLKDLVDLRNRLVHHFVDQHDLGSVDGCRRAQAALVEALARIDAHYQRLESIARSDAAARHRLADVLRTEAFRQQLTQATGRSQAASD